MFSSLKRRLHLQIYATIILSLLLVVFFVGFLFAAFEREGFDERVSNITLRLTWRALPPPTAPVEEQREALFKLLEGARLSVSLFDENRGLIAAYGRPVPPPLPDARTDDEGGWSRHRGVRGFGPVWLAQLPDKRWLAVDMREGGRMRPLFGLLMILIGIAAAIGLGSYPLVRKLTGRLERLQGAVNAVRKGDLSTRVAIEGQDEVAALAESFNSATATIERLINSNRQLLANASHELRTPLARVRLGVEMLKNKPDPKRQAALETDIGELDELIDEILLMSRLEAGGTLNRIEEVDLLALASEECARYEDCTLEGNEATVSGDANLLRRAIRNLLDNAHKHGAPPVQLEITSGDRIIISVADSGPGVRDDQMERIFEPFHRAPGKQNVEGYGLGLALVRQIAEAHGGRISVANGPSAGAVFTLELPVPA